MPDQLVFELPVREALGAEDFMVTASNDAAVGLIDRWPDWPHWAGVVAGPQGTGKTHLAHVWRHRSNAALVPAATLAEETLEAFAQTGAMVVEDLDRGISDQRLLFHLLNLAREHRRTILLTTRIEPGRIELTLPDLRSRLRALPLVSIAPPDDALLRAVLVKLFSDRQLLVSPQVINHLAIRMDRSMAAAAKIVATVDRIALARKAKVTRALAQAALDELESERNSAES